MKKRILLMASAAVGFFVALISGGGSTNTASADAAVQNQFQDVSGPCPGPGCCGG